MKPEQTIIPPDFTDLVMPRDIKAGDKFPDPITHRVVWVALHDARLLGREVHVDVQFATDGGCSTRVWDNDDIWKLRVARNA